jgi:hypothetical protein
MKALLTIPTGLLPKAQGCAPRATLGHASYHFPNPNGVASIPSARAVATPGGVDANGCRLPKVAAQPWAGGRCPLGAIQSIARFDILRQRFRQSPHLSPGSDETK